jgi:hypothetical protein
VDPRVRPLIAALLSGIVAALVVGVTANTTATAPLSAYLWFASGVLSYWLITSVRAREPDHPRPFSRAVANARASIPLYE